GHAEGGFVSQCHGVPRQFFASTCSGVHELPGSRLPGQPSRQAEKALIRRGGISKLRCVLLKAIQVVLVVLPAAARATNSASAAITFTADRQLDLGAMPFPIAWRSDGI